MISFMRKSIELLSLLITFFSCGSGNSNVTAKSLPIAVDTVSYEIIGVPNRGVFVIKDTIDLNNRRCTLPEGITLKFKGGVIKNGTLVGNKTKINCEEGIFNRVRILGTWIAPVIKTSCFTDLSYDNALKDVLALSDSSVNNKIYIEEGNYQVTAYKNGDVCISVSSNTQLIINGVSLRPITTGITILYRRLDTRFPFLGVVLLLAINTLIRVKKGRGEWVFM